MQVFSDGILFPEWGPVTSSAPSRNKLKYEQDKLKINNLHLLSYPSFSVEGVEDMPIVQSFCDDVPDTFIPFSCRGSSSCSYSYGVHCFEYDYRINSIWNDPLSAIDSLKRFRCVIAPDYSLFVDQPRAVNVTNVYRNRWVSCLWSSKGIIVIPSASWGSAESFSYCFDGLPQNSVIAIGHVAVGKNRAQKSLFRMGTEELILRKQPTKLLVYGSPLDFDPGVEVINVKGIIQKLRCL